MNAIFVNLHLEAMKEDLEEFIRDENFDMLEEFPEEEIADIVLAVASKLLTLRNDVVEYPITSCGGIWNYQIKVNNRMKGFVSLSSEELGTTGVSRTEYKPFYSDEEDGYYSGLCSLAQMINEAWWQCNC